MLLKKGKKTLMTTEECDALKCRFIRRAGMSLSAAVLENGELDSSLVEEIILTFQTYRDMVDDLVSSKIMSVEHGDEFIDGFYFGTIELAGRFGVDLRFVSLENVLGRNIGHG